MFIYKLRIRLRKLGKTNQLIAMVVSSLFSIALIAYRVDLSSTVIYRFLIWNLFLAWIPYIIALFLHLRGEELKSRWIFAFGIGAWLLFFPNAPYILTDLFHLKHKPPVPHWFDLILLVSVAWNGMILGLLSLTEIRQALTHRIGAIVGWTAVIVGITAGSFGIYIGRFLRWNSWDVVTNPLSLWEDISQLILHPLQHPSTIGVTVLFSIFLLISYFTLISLGGVQQRSNSDR